MWVAVGVVRLDPMLLLLFLMLVLPFARGLTPGSECEETRPLVGGELQPTSLQPGCSAYKARPGRCASRKRIKHISKYEDKFTTVPTTASLKKKKKTCEFDQLTWRSVCLFAKQGQLALNQSATVIGSKMTGAFVGPMVEK